MKKRMKNVKKNKKGFTLIEMIVVIVIIAILAAITVPAIMKYIDEARETKLITAAGSFKTSIEADLAKASAKNADGKFTVTDITTAITNAKVDITNIDATSKVCSTAPTEATPTCTAIAANSTMKDIKGYEVIFTDNDKKVLIAVDGSAFVANKK